MLSERGQKQWRESKKREGGLFMSLYRMYRVLSMKLGYVLLLVVIWMEAHQDPLAHISIVPK